LLQMDGLLTKKEVEKVLDYGFESAEEVYKSQKEAIKKRYTEENSDSFVM